MKTAYLVAKFVRIGPFYFVVELGIFSEALPTDATGFQADHQFQHVMDSATADTFDAARRLLEQRMAAKPNLVRMREHVEHWRGLIYRGLETFKHSAWVKGWGRT